MKKNITIGISLNKDVVNKVKERINDYGGKISPLINKLLKEWLIKNV